MFVEIETHGFTAQSFGFKGRLLNHIVGLLPKQIIAIIHGFDVKLLAIAIFINKYHAILSVNGGVTHTNLNIYQIDHRISYSTTQFGDYIFMNNSV